MAGIAVPCRNDAARNNTRLPTQKKSQRNMVALRHKALMFFDLNRD
jgi:hypothetical protein